MLLVGHADAGPGDLAFSADLAGGLPMASVKRGSDVPRRVSFASVVGVHAGYRYSERGIAGVYGEYGIGNGTAEPCISCGYTIEAEARLVRFGIEVTREYSNVLVALGAGYELLSVNYAWLDQMNRFRWRGFELLRPTAGFVAYTNDSVTVVPYASLALTLFDREARNGREHWIANEPQGDQGEPGMRG